jgi:tetratricopeptide (TPR) repeat protein
LWGQCYGLKPNHYILHLMVRLLFFLSVFLLASAAAQADGEADADAGVARLEAQDPRTAIELFTRAIQSKLLSQEKLALTYHRRGMAFYMQGEAGRAILDYTIALWHDDLPREFRPRTLNNRGLAFEALNQYETALRDYGLSIRLNPNYAEAYANRGNLRRRFNLNAEAVLDFDMALRSGHARPQYVFAWQGMALEALGKRREAADSFRRALQIDSGFVEARTHLARLDGNSSLPVAGTRRIASNGRGGPFLSGQPWAGDKTGMLPGLSEGDSISGPWQPPSVAAGPSIVQASAPVAGPDVGVGLRPGLGERVEGAGRSSGEYFVQLGAYETADQARQGWDRIARVGRGLVDGLRHEVVRVEVAGRGTLYRLFGGALAAQREAQALCNALEDRGASCVVVRR